MPDSPCFASSTPNLYLTGFMGTGKSSIGREVAKALRYRFIDSDRAIEKAAAMKIPQIFAEKGESWFREREREFIETGHPSERCVVACGGGLIVPEGMRELVESRGVLVALFASPETILARTSRNKNRPLLQVADPESEIRKLLAERSPIYHQVDRAVSTDGRSFSEVREAVLRIYRSGASSQLSG
ncbi:MAG: shikimate kinase [Verrucomicrobiota bacterium]